MHIEAMTREQKNAGILYLRSRVQIEKTQSSSLHLDKSWVPAYYPKVSRQ